MRRITAAALALALIGAVSCGDGPSESKPSESGKPESSAAEERAVSAKDLALAVKNVHMELSAAAPEDPVFGKAVAVGKLEKGDIFGDRLLPALRSAGLSVRLKAVLTPTNRDWNCGQLYQELKGEAAAFDRKK